MKQQILDNVSQYNPEQLVGFIQQGIVSFDELCNETDGEFSAAARKEVKRLLKAAEDADWQNALLFRTSELFDKFLRKYPHSTHIAEATWLRDRLLREEEEARKQAEEKKVWEEVNKNDIGALQEFVRNHPEHPNVSEARQFINKLYGKRVMTPADLEKRIQDVSTSPLMTPQQKSHNIKKAIKEFAEQPDGKNDFLELLGDNSNLLSAGLVRELVEEDFFSLPDLEDVGIHRDFLDALSEERPTKEFPEGGKIEAITKKCTEIYFWGIPSSGKTCALGGILSVANSGKVARAMHANVHSQGYGYMTELMNLFHDGEVGELMAGTPIDAFYEMGFDLVDQEGKVHPITCIDMAGELMRCLYKVNGSKLGETERDMLGTLNRVLVNKRSGNRKMHFFVIEYGAEKRKYEGLDQKSYLIAAADYIRDQRIFDKDTDAVYILLTKADRAKTNNPEVFLQYIEQHYKGFYQKLEDICQKYEINGGKVEKVGFSLGTVCFQNYCRFDDRAAANIVDIMLRRSQSSGNGWFDKLLAWFRG